jgi:hypothetical protein
VRGATTTVQAAAPHPKPHPIRVQGMGRGEFPPRVIPAERCIASRRAGTQDQNQRRFRQRASSGSRASQVGSPGMTVLRAGRVCVPFTSSSSAKRSGAASRPGIQRNDCRRHNMRIRRLLRWIPERARAAHAFEDDEGMDYVGLDDACAGYLIRSSAARAALLRRLPARRRRVAGAIKRE